MAIAALTNGQTGLSARTTLNQAISAVNTLGEMVTTLTSAAIQAAIDARAALGGGPVYLAAGSFAITDFVEVKDNVSLIGAGRGATVLEGASSISGGGSGSFAIGVVGCLGVENASIRSLTVDLATNSIGTNGIVLTGETSYNDSTVATYCLVDDCEVLMHDDESGPSGYGIWNRNGKRNNITNNVVIGADTSYDSDSQNEGIEIFGGEDVLVSGNFLTDVGNAGIFVTTATGSNAVHNKNITITDNHIKSCGIGIGAITTAVNSGTTYITDGLVVSNNHVNDCFEECIRIQQTLDANAASDVAASKIVVTGNTFEVSDGLSGASDIIVGWFGQDGSLDGVWEGCLIQGNIFAGGEGVFGSTVQIRYLDGCNFSNNIVMNNSTANGSSYAMYVLNSDGVKIESNKFENIYSSALNCNGTDSIAIINNQFVNITNNNGLHTVYLNGTIAGATVQGNVSEHLVSGSVRFVNANSNVTYLYALGNVYKNNHTIQQIANMDAATCNFGTVSSGVSTTATISSNQITLGSHVSVNQSGGTPEAFTVAITDGTATITKAGSTDLDYDYLII